MLSPLPPRPLSVIPSPPPVASFPEFDWGEIHGFGYTALQTKLLPVPSSSPRPPARPPARLTCPPWNWDRYFCLEMRENCARHRASRRAADTRNTTAQVRSMELETERLCITTASCISDRSSSQAKRALKQAFVALNCAAGAELLGPQLPVGCKTIDN